MDIYVVQSGDTINSIAEQYGISVERLISDNGLINPNALVQGQAIVILYPQRTYTVEPGDTLASIVDKNGISMMQLIRNNPFLYERDYIYPGESLVISFGADKNIQVNGYAYSYINRDILKQSLPYLTYLSVYNYRIVNNANIISYGDDTDIIMLAKEYQAIPLLMPSAFSPTGEVNLDYVYDVLLDNEKQNNLINEMLQIVRAKGFLGINSLVNNMFESNQSLHFDFYIKLSKALRDEGYIFMVTINPHLKETENGITYEKLDYQRLSQIVDRINFLQNVWEMSEQPPQPISNISLIRPFIDDVTTMISPEMISVGKPLIGYDWTLPFVPKISKVYLVSLNSAIILAYDQRTVIQLDEESQTPYYNYIKSFEGVPESHILWFIDARSIKALDDVIIEYNLGGSGFWNLSIYYQQIWSIINASFNIVK